MARMGTFQGQSTPYGVPPAVVHPPDNNIVPSASQAESDALASEISKLYEDIKNAGRDPNAGKARIVNG